MLGEGGQIVNARCILASLSANIGLKMPFVLSLLKDGS